MHLVSRLRQALGLLVSLTVSLIVLANASSIFLADKYPDLALAINPANPDARLRLVEIAFANQKTAPDMNAQKAIVMRGIDFEPYDARLYSLLGAIEEIAGDPSVTVQGRFVHALALNPTDFRALIRRYAFTASNGEIGQALGLAELIFRAWPQFWDLIEPNLPALLSSEEGYQQAYERFALLPGGPRSILRSLARTNTGLAIAKRLLIEWHNNGIEDLRPAINEITSRLVVENEPLQAFLLFGLTLNETERDQAGYVFNPNFALDPNGNLFDWSLPAIRGLSAQLVNTSKGSISHQSGTPAQQSRALEIKFLNTPIRLSAVLQTLRLPASGFSWSITYSTHHLSDPGPVELQIKCRTNAMILGSLTLDATGGKTRQIEIPLTVPASDCPLQQIMITNGKLAQSWQNRYSGSIMLHQLQFHIAGS